MTNSSWVQTVAMFCSPDRNGWPIPDGRYSLGIRSAVVTHRMYLRSKGWLSTASRSRMAYSSCLCTSSKPSNAACRRPRSRLARIWSFGDVEVCVMYASWKVSSTFCPKSWSKTWIIEPWRSEVRVLWVDWVAYTRIRVYATQSTHKTLTSLRQGSMIHVFDQDFGQKVEETFHEAYMTHTSTSPNYQILASLDLGRRQAVLEGFELVHKQLEYAMRLRDAVDNHPLLRKYMRCVTTADLIPSEYRPSGIGQPLRSGLQNMTTVWQNDEFVMDPCRVTI